MKISQLLPLAIIIISFSSCLKDKTEPFGECNTVISYTSEIIPIIESSCKTGTGAGTGCHDSWIDEHDNIKGYMVSNRWQNSVLIEETMPKFPNTFGIDSLTEDEFQTMKCWIEQGYPNN